MKKFGPMDIIVCNAAMVANKSRATKEDLDEMFVVNYFAKFLLAKQILKGNLLNQDGPHLPRIIIVAGYYKLLLLTMANELSRRLNPEDKIRCSVFALCPGPVNSNIAREAPRLFQPLLKLVFGIFFRSPKKACRPVVYLAASKELEGSTGNYMFLMQEKAMDGKAVDPENGSRLWDLSEQLEKRIIN
jgi:NAD(P)-dependent dehydrogenase (short-subunit alcohol dehydrogenase family)